MINISLAGVDILPPLIYHEESSYRGAFNPEEIIGKSIKYNIVSDAYKFERCRYILTRKY